MLTLVSEAALWFSDGPRIERWRDGRHGLTREVGQQARRRCVRLPLLHHLGIDDVALSLDVINFVHVCG